MSLKCCLSHVGRILKNNALIAFASLICAAPSQADILISPQRVVLDDDNRQTVISLHNPGKITRSYRLTWVERRLGEDGQLSNIKEGENPRSIVTLVRYSPRRVTVAPGQTQTVRLDFRPTPELAPGEYRSHLRIGVEPPEDGSGGTEVASGKQGEMTFRLNALMSFAVPVFVRHGAGKATAEITAVEPTKIMRDNGEEPGLKVTLKRGGEFSSYGRLVVYQQLSANAPVEQISETGGVAMYTEVTGQTRVINLKPGSRLLPGSWIRITYEGEGPDQGKLFAERSFQIGK